MITSIKNEDKSFQADGYTSLAIIYFVFSIFNWTAPSAIDMIGPKIAMMFGAVTYM